MVGLQKVWVQAVGQQGPVHQLAADECCQAAAPVGTAWEPASGREGLPKPLEADR